jgi:carboxylate-amine ligase
LDGKSSGFLDTRLTYYKSNQSRIPSITGLVIPESIDSETDYQRQIFEKIQKDIAPFDLENILDPVWVNSRGAITRFDRGSIEIRIMDVQECPSADLAIVTLVIETLKALVKEQFISHKEQLKWETTPLAELLDKTILAGPHAVLENAEYLKVFGIKKESASAKEIWQIIINRHINAGNENLKRYMPELNIIQEEGTLSDRILKSLDSDFSKENLTKVYKQLAFCLSGNKMFSPAKFKLDESIVA